MKTLHPARRRIVIGILLLAMAFFYAFAPSCGVVGWAISRASGYLIGQTGSALLALTLLVVGTLFVLPHDFLRSIAQWFTRGRQARVDRVVAEMDEDARFRSIARNIESATAKALARAEMLKESSISPTARRNLDAVRDALKSLQYKSHEYEPLVRAMDPSVPFETLVKSALKKLNEKRN